MRDFTDSYRSPAMAFVVPQIREAWLRAKLAEFDRLTGKGMSETKAARRLGLADVQALRRSVDRCGVQPSDAVPRPAELIANQPLQVACPPCSTRPGS